MPNIKISELDPASAVGSSVVPVSDASGTITNKVTLQDIADLKSTYDSAVPWTANHTLADGTRYLVNDLVYESGYLYKANFDNESIPVSSETYWTNVGVGYRLNIDGRDIPNIPYPVDSVNGQTGDVELSTTDLDDFNTAVSGLLPVLNIISGSGINVSSISGEFTISATGDLTIPVADIDLHNGGIQSAQVLQFNDTSKQSVITGPTPEENSNAQRLIIQGQRASGTYAEGGDVYLWGGDADYNGGDIKIYAGDADNVSPDNGYGGYVNIDGGKGATEGGNIEITAGYSESGQAGNVNIIGGPTASGIAGNVTIKTNNNNNTWTFDKDGNLQLPSNLSISSLSNYVPVNGTVIQQASGELLNIISPGSGGGIALGWVENLFGPGDVASISFNEIAGEVRINTGDFTETLHTWSYDINGNLTIPGNITLPNNSTIASGTYDNGYGGNGGISLNCIVGYELNWQGGHLKSTYNNGSNTVQIYCDSPIEFQGSGIDNMEINSSGLIFPDGTTQSSANITSTNITDFDSAVSGLLPVKDIISGTGISVSSASGVFTIATSGVSLDGHTHIASDITDFNSSVSGLLPVKDIVSGTGISVSSVSGVFTIDSSLTSVSEASKLVTTAYNKTGSPIPKMSVVYIDGGQGDMPTITLATASGESGSSKTYGITAEAISNMSSGKVIVEGALTGLNTDQFNPTAPTGNVNGTVVYLSPTVAGGITTTKPSAPNHLVAVGTIVRTHQNEGVIEVRIQNGFELQELHNVKINGVAHQDILVYNSGNSLWENNNSGVFSSLSGSGQINFNTKWTGSKTIGSGIIYDDGTNIGIGTSSPTAKLNVEGGNIIFNDNGGDYDFRIEGDTDPHLFYIDASSNTVNIGTSSSGANKLLVVADNPQSYTNILASGGITNESSFIRISNISSTTSDSFAGLSMAPTRSGSNVGQGGLISCVATNMTTYTPNMVFAFRSGITSYVEYMRIRHNGNVGIGNNSPDYKLHVAGTGHFENLLVNGTGVSLVGHSHTASNISDFNSTVSGLLPSGIVTSNTTGIPGANSISNIVTISQVDYNNLGSYDPNTIYYIV